MIKNFTSIFWTNTDASTNQLYTYFGIAAGCILFLVIFFTYYFSKKYRAKQPDELPEQKEINHKFELFILILAICITAFFLIMSINTMQQIQDIPENPKPDLVITGHQWWWEAKYPQSGVLTANEIHIPVGKRILLEVNSADVIHSWWVPALGRKIDMIPGLKNYIWLYADKPREYLGACSEFCGIEHARMRIRVVADTEEDFKKWTESQLEPVITQATPLFDKGKALFEQKTCTNCHGINGTPFSENIGPNLTHFGSRKRFLSDMKPVTRENLKEWLTNPQNVKPGVKMPNFIFNPDEIEALTEYIYNLK
ncbi:MULTISPECIES: cytochrome c oxidase subunit II [unclassified Leeuwenhoekiella]|uniref:cytochrome c oxidase subunit II n=1 Tax=unclassified Leeuwenhoekiella TaxID=2615029 RepID=UPI0025BB7385|nr:MULTISPECIES: cytochrome c oxidase subunit II [unclassified Leeuwenhoekiella]|tara:strand:- start:14578 stop:15510 length:933 start_codon:yes stop_codon:yes gene_type:complete